MHPGLASAAATLIASSAAMTTVLMQLVRVAKNAEPVVLVGETGTGKTTIARVLHQLSGRPGFMAEISAPELVPTLAHSQLFGHDRGAFTGADRSRKGLFEEAGGSSVFIDEFHLLKRPSQELLLRVLGQGATYRAIGASRVLELRARLIVATQVSFDELLRRRRLAPDLRWRVGIHEVRIPPLAERREDIASYAAQVLQECRPEDGSLGATRLSSDAVAALELGSWPGNLWQLRAVVLSASVNAMGEPEIRFEHLPPDAQIAPRFDPNAASPVKRQLVKWALWRSRGRVDEAARLIGAHRNTISKFRGEIDSVAVQAS
jgi:two-component system response regulator HydG